MNEYPYYPSEEQQRAALAQYDLNADMLSKHIERLNTEGIISREAKTLINQYITLNKNEDNVKYRVTIPAGKVQTTVNVKNQLVGIPDLGEAEHYLMDEDEFKSWVEMWQADGATGQIAIIEQVRRG